MTTHKLEPRDGAYVRRAAARRRAMRHRMIRRCEKWVQSLPAGMVNLSVEGYWKLIGG